MTKTANQLTVGGLLELLRGEHADDYVEVDGLPFTVSIADLVSYRGYYDDVALEPKCAQYPRRVEDLVDMLEAQIGRTLAGYKGGTYRTAEDTPVWIASNGEASAVAVTGVRSVPGRRTIVLTWEKEREA